MTVSSVWVSSGHSGFVHSYQAIKVLQDSVQQGSIALDSITRWRLSAIKVQIGFDWMIQICYFGTFIRIVTKYLEDVLAQNWQIRCENKNMIDLFHNAFLIFDE